MSCLVLGTSLIGSGRARNVVAIGADMLDRAELLIRMDGPTV
jgi:hypothetical protein